jgi:hypothetical protein
MERCAVMMEKHVMSPAAAHEMVNHARDDTQRNTQAQQRMV